jgi:glycerol uptake facilitator-like aquaporin
MTRARRIAAEAVGTAFLLAAVVGSGIMGERLAGGNVAIALLANTLATGAMLVTLILTFGPISGAHFNPTVTLADASQGGLAWREFLDTWLRNWPGLSPGSRRRISCLVRLYSAHHVTPGVVRLKCSVSSLRRSDFSA